MADEVTPEGVAATKLGYLIEEAEKREQTLYRLATEAEAIRWKVQSVLRADAQIIRALRIALDEATHANA